MTTIAHDLSAAIAAVCPIVGVSIGRIADRSTWRIDFAEEATPAQRAAARNVLSSFDPVAAQRVAEAKLKILSLEGGQDRAMREAVLTVLGAGNTKLHQLEAQIAAERAVIEANKGR